MKQLLDYIVAALGLLLCIPLLLYIMVRIRLENAGSIFYRQERLGRGGIPFRMIKFRTMVPDAETGQPLLAEVNDGRVTPFGRTLRKYHWDELPQLWNVLRCEMSMVGPRPERAYFVQQIEQQYPEYRELLNVKPGVTSLGMVKYGYANTIGKIVERSQYDLYYLKHYNLYLDLRILAATVREIWKGRGI